MFQAFVALVLSLWTFSSFASESCSEIQILKANKTYQSYKRSPGVLALEGKHFVKTEMQKCQLSEVRDSVKKGNFFSLACPQLDSPTYVGCLHHYLGQLSFLSFKESDPLDMIVLKVVNKDLQTGKISWFASDVQSIELRLTVLERLGYKKSLAFAMIKKSKQHRQAFMNSVYGEDSKNQKKAAFSLYKSIAKDIKKAQGKSRQPATSEQERIWADGVLKQARNRLNNLRKILWNRRPKKS